MSEDGPQRLVKTLKALANPIRLRIIALLFDEPKHAYALAKEMGLSYPLTHLHIKGLRKLGLIEDIEHETTTGGRPTARIYAPAKFELLLTPENIRDMMLLGGEE